MAKQYDLVVKTGTYVNKQGETKNQYENVGAVMQGENGLYMIMKRTFNPAGVPNPQDKDSVIISMFEPNNGQQQAPRQQQQQSPQGGDSFGDEIPFMPLSSKL